MTLSLGLGLGVLFGCLLVVVQVLGKTKGRENEEQVKKGVGLHDQESFKLFFPVSLYCLDIYRY